MCWNTIIWEWNTRVKTVLSFETNYITAGELCSYWYTAMCWNSIILWTRVETVFRLLVNWTEFTDICWIVSYWYIAICWDSMICGCNAHSWLNMFYWYTAICWNSIIWEWNTRVKTVLSLETNTTSWLNMFYWYAAMCWNSIIWEWNTHVKTVLNLETNTHSWLNVSYWYVDGSHWSMTFFADRFQHYLYYLRMGYSYRSGIRLGGKYSQVVKCSLLLRWRLVHDVFSLSEYKNK